MLRILIAEDEAHNREAISELLRRMGHEPVLAQDGREALELASTTKFDLVLSDVRMPNMDGLQFFESFRLLHARGTPFVFMTAYGRMEEAVEAMRKGALNFLSKPLRKKDLIAIVDEARKIKASHHLEDEKSTRAAQESGDSGDAIFASRAFADVVELVDRVAPSLASVLFVGESGTGKEVLARRLHAKSGRDRGPFIAFHSGAMPETLLESELFGHEKGAFTGAESARMGQIRSAHKGTFFLDELSAMPLGVQAKLLRVIQDRTVTPLGASAPVETDVRWVSATNEALEPLVAQGRFREDLLYRLRVVVIELPPLRERPEDIFVLCEHFMGEFAQREGRSSLRLDSEVRSLLENYPWPGNVRELRNVIERAVALAPVDATVFGAGLLPEHIAQSSQAREIRVVVGASLQSVEDKLIEETLRSCGGDKARAAAILGVAQRTIYRWLERKSPTL